MSLIDTDIKSAPLHRIKQIKAIVAENRDDGREEDDTTWYSTGNGGNVITFGHYSASLHTAAFRFRDLQIPRESKIILARLRLRPASTDGSDPDVKLVIKGIKESNTQPFSQESRPSQRSKTVNSVQWNIIKPWEAHEWVQTPNLQLIVEEIVAQNDWEMGNAIAFVIEDNGSADGQAETCWDQSKGSGYEAELEIWYSDESVRVTVGFLAGNDRDGNETDGGDWDSSPAGNVLTLGNDGADKFDCGLIFSGIAIPPKAQIVQANLLIVNADQNNRFPNVMIKGFAEDDAPPFQSDGSNKPSTRTKTAAQKEWTIGGPVSGVHVGIHWSAESVYESPDISEIIQEVIDRSGWEEGNKIGVVLEDHYSWSGQYKLPWDYIKSSGAYAVKLVIAWQERRTRIASQRDVAVYDKDNYPSFIVVHHSATPRDSTQFQTIKNNHLGIGWGDIGYHHWIAGALDGDGVHIEGRDENTIGAHADTYKANYRSIGVALCGDFQPSAGNEQPSQNQLDTLQELLDSTRRLRNIPRELVFGHREVPGEATNCPGDNLLTYIENYRATGKLQP